MSVCYWAPTYWDTTPPPWLTNEQLQQRQLDQQVAIERILDSVPAELAAKIARQIPPFRRLRCS